MDAIKKRLRQPCRHQNLLNIEVKKIKKYNTYDLSGEYGIGYTTKGEKFLFDLEDYEKIKDYCWCVDKTDTVVQEMTNLTKIFICTD